MANCHDEKKVQTNVWLTVEFRELLESEAKKKGKTLTTLCRELLHAHYAQQCPYRMEDYYNPGGWELGRPRGRRLKAAKSPKGKAVK